MGRSAGPGSPVVFMCPKARNERYYGHSGVAERHRVTLTGRTKPYKPPAYSAIGQRSTFVSREYTCACGHKGWSNHADLARLAEMQAKEIRG